MRAEAAEAPSSSRRISTTPSFSCYHALGPEVVVVTVLAGIPPAGEPGSWDREQGVADSPARMRERRREDIEALALSGSRVVHLDLLDSQYADLPPAAEVAAILAQVLEPAARVLGPAGIRNLDHKVVRDAVLIARPDAMLYADLPYALHPDFGGFALPEEIADRDVEQVELRLAEDALAEKLAAVRCYRTQLDQRHLVRRLRRPRRAGPRSAVDGLQLAQPALRYTGVASGLAFRKTAAARRRKPTPARISATPTTMAKIETPVAM